MKEKDFVKALELRGPEFEEMLHGFRAVASIAKEEKMLPGLGVLFELIWEHSDSENKQTMIDSLQNSLKERNSH